MAWKNGCFVDDSKWQLHVGLDLCLGHGGARCPKDRSQDTTKADVAEAASADDPYPTPPPDFTRAAGTSLHRTLSSSTSLDPKGTQADRDSSNPPSLLDVSDSEDEDEDQADGDGWETDDPEDSTPKAKAEISGAEWKVLGGRAEFTATRSVATITHTNGLHFIPLRFCTCADAAPLDEQLLAAGLYPATQIRPQSAFTFDMLDDCILDKIVSKNPTRNYFTKLRRWTTSVFPDKVSVSRVIVYDSGGLLMVSQEPLQRVAPLCSAVDVVEAAKADWLCPRLSRQHSPRQGCLCYWLSRLPPTWPESAR